MAYELTETITERACLEKGCTEQQLRDYFNGLLVLFKSGEEYPVDLDDVWMVAYSEKSKAVRALKHAFVEGEDYLPMARKGERASDGRFTSETQKVTYKLTVECLEYFIVKKVRAVFEVYRKVFKKVATGEIAAIQSKPKNTSELLLMFAQQLVDNEKRIEKLESKSNSDTEIEYTTIVGFAKRFGIELPLKRAVILGKHAKTLCCSRLIETGTVPDPRFGIVRTYPDGILYETFEKYYPNIQFR